MTEQTMIKKPVRNPMYDHFSWSHRFDLLVTLKGGTIWSEGETQDATRPKYERGEGRMNPDTTLVGQMIRIGGTLDVLGKSVYLPRWMYAS